MHFTLLPLQYCDLDSIFNKTTILSAAQLYFSELQNTKRCHKFNVTLFSML